LTVFCLPTRVERSHTVMKTSSSSSSGNLASLILVLTFVVLQTGASVQAQGVGNILTSSLFTSFFPSANSFYTYDSFIAAANAYPSFGTTGTSDQQLQEVAAFCAHVKQETSGLQYINEINPSSNYCDSTNTQYPCAPGQSYYGRGPLQISW
jgi:chitinase